MVDTVPMQYVAIFVTNKICQQQIKMDLDIYVLLYGRTPGTFVDGIIVANSTYIVCITNV